MKIKKINLLKYGPLEDIKIDNLNNFNLIYGNNEEGKTLLLEALIKFFIRKKTHRNLIDKLERVEESPEGFVYIKNENEEIKYPEDNTFLEDYNLTMEDFNNIFLIRDSDLRIKEDKYYIDFTNKLVGLKTEKIKKIKENIRDIGNLTDNYTKIASTKNNNQLGSRVEKAKKYIEIVDETIKYLKEKDYDKLVKEKVELKNKLNNKRNTLKNLEDAKKRIKYEKSQKLVNDLKNINEKIDSYRKITNDKHQRLKNIERDLENKKVEFKDRNTKIKSQQERLDNIKEELNSSLEKKQSLEEDEPYYNELKNRFENIETQTLELNKIKNKKNKIEDVYDEKEKVYRQLKKKKEKIDTSSQLIYRLEEIYPELDLVSDKIKTGRKASVLTFILSMMILVILGFYPSIYLKAALGIFSFLFLLSVIISGSYLYKSSKYKKIYKRVKVLLKKVAGKSVDKENILSVIDNIKNDFEDAKIEYEKKLREKNRIQDKYDSLMEEINNSKKEIEKLKIKLGSTDKKDKLLKELKNFRNEFNLMNRKVDKLKAEINTIEKNIKEYEREKIDIEKKIRELTFEKQNILGIEGVSSISEYENKLEEKFGYIESAKDRVKELNYILNEDINFDIDKVKEIIEYFKKSLRKLDKYKNKAERFRYTEEKYQDIKNDIESYTEEISEIKENIEKYEEKLNRIEIKINDEIFRDAEEHYYTETIADLEKIKNELKNFVERWEKRFEESVLTIELINELKKEETKKVSELFGKETDAAKYFKKITNHRYDEIIFDSKNASIKVKKSTGKLLEPYQLSGGTLDQLYLSIRLAMGSKIFNDKKGFYLFDDPFVKSDINRLKKQLEILFDLAEEGFQFLYFTAKKEVLDCVSNSNRKLNKIYKINGE